jgi:hypothetical protein
MARDAGSQSVDSGEGSGADDSKAELLSTCATSWN